MNDLRFELAAILDHIPVDFGGGCSDAFPTGSCIEAGLCGVAVLCTDPLNQNIAFKEGEEIIIVPREAEAICAIVDQYHDRPEDLYRLSEKGKKALEKAFGIETQMKPRPRKLSELLESRSKTGDEITNNITGYANVHS